MTVTAAIPEGFALHTRKSGLTEPWEPIYSRRTEEALILGIVAGPQHCNARGFVHGGLISALADNALGHSCGMRHQAIGGLVTLSLTVDFVRAAQQGQWLEFVTTYVKAGGSVDTAQGRVTADGEVCALISANFKILKAPAKAA